MSPSTCHVKNLDVCYSVGDDEKTKDTTTPLIEAAVSSNEKVVTYLLKHGASVNFPKVMCLICPCDFSLFQALRLQGREGANNRRANERGKRGLFCAYPLRSFISDSKLNF